MKQSGVGRASFVMLFALLCIYFYPTTLHAQGNPVALKHARTGYDLEQQGKLSEALYEYNAAIAADAKYPYPVERIAAMYQQLHNYPLAIQFYSRAIKLDSASDVYSFYNLGLSYRAMAKHDSAVTNFKEFVRRMQPVSKADTLSIKDADWWIQFNLGCLAERAKPKDTSNPTSISPNINSEYDEFGPSVTADGETLYFTSRQPSTNRTVYAETGDFGDDLFVVHKDSAGNWGMPHALPLPINSADDEGAASVTADGQSLYYSLCRRPDGFGECDLYISELAGENFSRPQNLGVMVNSAQWDAQPSLTPDGHTMYFSSRRAGSIDGSEDIWVAYKSVEGTWGKPVNLGEPVNTKFSERSPFIAADGKTLYFSSNGHPGFGNHDLFMSRKLEDGTWSVPVNLGSPINAEGDDVFPTIPARGAQMYYSSQRSNPKGDLDIYQVTLPTRFRPGPVTVVAGIVYDSKTHKPLAATLEVTDLKTNELRAVYHTNAVTGKFFVPLGTGNTYAVTAVAPKYTFFSQKYTVPDTIAYRELIFNIPLIRVDSMFASIDTNSDNTNTNTKTTDTGNVSDGTNGIDTTNHPGGTHVIDTSVAVPLNNLFFDFNKATLQTESIPELKNLIRFLKENSTIRIQISGHTDSVGTAEFNMRLSQARAESVRIYLVQHGISSARLSAKGYGEAVPVADNGTEEGRRQNRRTEFRILK